MAEFEEYLISKKIDALAFREKEGEMYEEWERLFEVTHPNSFTQQKLFLINPTRRKYPLQEKKDLGKAANIGVAPKPKIKLPHTKKND